MHFLTKLTLALVLTAFVPAEPFPPLVTVKAANAQRTNFGVRVSPGASPTGAESHDLFVCTVDSVTDGDTFRCTDGTRIRLSAIDTAERPGSCRPGRNCAPGNPYAAKSALAGMISGRTVKCQPCRKELRPGYSMVLSQRTGFELRDDQQWSRHAAAALRPERAT